MTILRRMRGVLETAVLWAIAWSVLAVPPVLYGWWRRESDYFDWLPLAILSRTVQLAAEWGALHGVLFALILIAVEGRHSLARLTLPRFAICGILAGVLVPLIFGSAWWWMFLPIDVQLTLWASVGSGLFGGAFAGVTFALARRETADPLLLPASSIEGRDAGG
jgi:hypothetical protein